MLKKELYNLEIQKAVYNTLSSLGYLVTDNFDKNKDSTRIFINDISLGDISTKTEQLTTATVYLTTYSISTSSNEGKILTKSVYDVFMNGLFGENLRAEGLELGHINSDNINSRVTSLDTTDNKSYQNIITFNATIGVLSV